MLRILHLDDCLADLELTDAALHNQGLKKVLLWASSRETFVTLLDKILFDVVLSDSGGPEFNGREALALVRARQPEAVFIFLTGHKEGPAFDALMRSRADGVFSKRDLPLLGEAIRRIVRTRGSRRA